MAQDYDTAGKNDLAFRRYYNSLANPRSTPTALGGNWRSNYDTYIRLVTATALVVERPDGQELNFTFNGSQWVPDSDVGYVLNSSPGVYLLTNPDNSGVSYQASFPEALARPVAIIPDITNPGTNTQTLTYDSSNRLINVTDVLGRQLTFTYQGNLLSTVKTPDGLVMTYGFNSSGVTPGVNDRLASVSFSTKPATSISYLYENAGLPFALTGLIDQNGKRYASWTYDGFGRALTSQHGTGADLITVSYDDATGNRTVTNALGQQSVYKFAILQNMPKLSEIDRLATATTAAATRMFSYDGNGYLSGTTDWNGVLTAYSNDAAGNVLSMTEASGTAQARTTSYSYVGNSPVTDFHLPSQIVAPGQNDEPGLRRQRLSDH